MSSLKLTRAKIYELLNAFGLQQPQLNQPGKPRNSSEVELGTLFENAETLQKTVAVTFDATSGAAVGSYDLGIDVPAGSIVTKVYTKTNTMFDDVGGGSTIEIKAGATTLVAAAPSSGFGGVEDQSAATPVEVAASSSVFAEVAVEALTDGKVTIYIHFDKPSLDA